MYDLFIPILMAFAVTITGEGTTQPVDLCVGANASTKWNYELQIELIDQLEHVDCWYNWSHGDLQMHSDPRYTPMIWSHKFVGDHIPVATSDTYMLYNEPEACGGNHQACTGADVAATYVISWSHQISQTVACCGVIIGEQGLQWLDDYLMYGGLVPDKWHIHIYATTVEDWENYLNTFVHWMQDRDLVRPIIISETSCMWVHECNVQLLKKLKNYHSTYVEKIYWFALTWENVFAWNGFLFEEDSLTVYGHTLNE